MQQNQKLARIKLKQELRSEFKGIFFTILGTIISSYGSLIPVIQTCVNLCNFKNVISKLIEF